VRAQVSEGYARVVTQGNSCCGGGTPVLADDFARIIGYTPAELSALPDGANLGLGCGNPTAIGALRPGDTVLDLGSGAGIDVFVAAKKVGPSGRVIGVDMTDEMLERARDNAREGGFSNVEFRKGIIEQLPVEDATVDVVMSNCVINLSPEKERVFAEIARVLRPGGRVMVSDIVLDAELPPEVRENLEAYIGCVAGAVLREEYEAAMKAAGLRNVTLRRKGSFGHMLDPDDPAVKEAMERWGLSAEQVREYGDGVASYEITAER